MAQLGFVVPHGAVPVEAVLFGQGLLPFPGETDEVRAVGVLGLPKVLAHGPQGLRGVLADENRLMTAVADVIFVASEEGIPAFSGFLRIYLNTVTSNASSSTFSLLYRSRNRSPVCSLCTARSMHKYAVAQFPCLPRHDAVSSFSIAADSAAQ